MSEIPSCRTIRQRRRNTSFNFIYHFTSKTKLLSFGPSLFRVYMGDMPLFFYYIVLLRTDTIFVYNTLFWLYYNTRYSRTLRIYLGDPKTWVWIDCG